MLTLKQGLQHPGETLDENVVAAALPDRLLHRFRIVRLALDQPRVQR